MTKQELKTDIVKPALGMTGTFKIIGYQELRTQLITGLQK